MKIYSRNVLWGLVLVVAISLAAGTFIANNQPFGYVAPAAISSGGFDSGTAVAYAPWFEDINYRGDLIAYPLTASGTPLMLSPLWHASIELAAQNFLSGRHIVTTDGAGTGMPFLWASLTPAYQAALGTEQLVNFIRGDRSNEGSAPTGRTRTNVLGDIIHSNPVYVKNPVAGYPDPAYLMFAASHHARPPRLFVGANDGMLHVFDALTGSEVYAYIPSMLIPKLPALANNPYAHNYYVDGALTAEDVVIDGNWRTVVVGGLAAGGIGHFALDATSAAVASDVDAMDKVLWEFHAGSTGAANLGYSYSRASIAQTNDDNWTAVIGNGYLSASGAASLFVLNIADGSVIREIIVPDAVANGLSSPTLVDLDGDFKIDIAYAGDRNGNLWKFDLTDVDPANWSVSNNTPLFQTDNASGKRQSITTAPVVGKHPEHGFMVYIGTGELLTTSDSLDASVQTVYGIWDNDWPVADLPVNISTLVTQELHSNSHANGAAVRTSTDNPVDWVTARGWGMPLLVSGGTALDKGERVLQNLILRDNRIQFITINPTVPSGDNWFIQLNAFTGGAPTKTVVDITEDKFLSVADNVDGDGNGTVDDVPLDRVVGSYLGFGLASLPVIGGTGANKTAVLFNQIEAISPAEQLAIPSDPGVVGGHFDVDTSSKIYTFNNGATDGHVHQWDDKHNLTTIDYFNLPDQGKLFGISGITNAVADYNTPFFLTISNSALSSGGVMEINGASFSVIPYQELQLRWMTGTMAPQEVFPVYKLGVLSAAEKAAGWQQLISLKMSFDAFAILKGELIGTNTGCVKGNDPGALGEYRNGALTLQAIDAKNFTGFTYDALNDVYIAANTALDGTHHYARVAPDRIIPGQTEYAESLLWESTVFWHWDGDCYGSANWQAQLDACLLPGATTCWNISKDKKDKSDKKKKKKKDKGDHDNDDSPPPEPGNPPPSGNEAEPDHLLESITTADGNVAGRLFWRELIPDN